MHPIESSDSKNLTYNELLSELILAKVNLATTSYELLRAKYNTRKGFHPAPFGIPVTFGDSQGPGIHAVPARLILGITYCPARALNEVRVLGCFVLNLALIYLP